MLRFSFFVMWLQVSRSAVLLVVAGSKCPAAGPARQWGSARWSWWNDWAKAALDSHAADGPWIRHVLTQRKNMKNNRNQWRRNFRTPSNIDVPRWGTFTDVIRYCTYFLIFLYWNALRQGLNISKWLQFNTNSRRITKNRTWVSCKWERAKSLGVLENRAPTALSHFFANKKKNRFETLPPLGSNRQRG